MSKPVAWAVTLSDGNQFIYDERMLKNIDPELHEKRIPLFNKSAVQQAVAEATAAKDAEIAELRTALAEAQARNVELREVLSNVGQALVWNCFGECRGYPESTTLMTLSQADVLAKEILSRPADYSALNEAALAKECERLADKQMVEQSKTTQHNYHHVFANWLREEASKHRGKK